MRAYPECNRRQEGTGLVIRANNFDNFQIVGVGFWYQVWYNEFSCWGNVLRFI